MKKKVAIIGSGVSGLASAVRLSSMGFHVDVYEKAENAGGKMNEIRSKGYRFDTGPSLFTLPELLIELYDLCQTPEDERIEILKPEICCRYFYPDKTMINGFQEQDKFASEVEIKTGEPASAILSFLNHSERVYTLTAPLFIFSSFADKQTLLNKKALEVVKKWRLLSPFLSMDKKNRKWFSSSKVRQLFNRYATYNGSNPYKAPATLNIIPHLEHNLGAYLPKGGIYQIAKTMQKLAEKNGTMFHFNNTIKEVVVKDKTAVGIIDRDDKMIPYDIVISDVDIYTFYSRLMKKNPLPKLYRNRELSSSAVIFYWGIKQLNKTLDVHNILFSNDYPSEFQSIFKNKNLSKDPTVYVYISSKLNPNDAPEDGENWFVMINAPNNIGQNWPEMIHQARSNIQQKIKQVLDINIAPLIEFEQILDPVKIESKTDSFRGALYGPSSNGKLAAFLRHPNYTHRLKNLYFSGGSAHPGGGIPLCLASAKIVSEKIIQRNK